MKAMKTASIIGGLIFAGYAVMLLVQIWTQAMSWELFFKWTATAFVMIVVVFGLALLYREYIEEKHMKDEGYLD
jgi:phosphate/sulfate permease